MFLNIYWIANHTGKNYDRISVESAIYVSENNILSNGYPKDEYVDKMMDYAINNLCSFINDCKRNNFHLRFSKHVVYTIELEFTTDYNYTLTYVYNNGYIQRYKISDSMEMRFEESDNNTVQKFYPVGSKVKLKFPTYDGMTEGIIVYNSEYWIDDKDFSNVYDIRVKKKWSNKSYVTLASPHYNDILECDKEPYTVSKNSDKID